jgi:hypothetical protein
VEEGDRARREPDAEVGEIWDSESLKDLAESRRKYPSVRVWEWGKSRIGAAARCIAREEQQQQQQQQQQRSSLRNGGGRNTRTNSPHQLAVVVGLES